jgi:methyltransferase-like protein
MGSRNYQGRAFKSLSVTPINDLKDMTNLLEKSDFGLENTYENIQSVDQFETILSSYVEAINKELDDIGT